MTLNPYFKQNQLGQKLEADLYQSMVTESIQIKGIEVFYIKRDSQNADNIWNEDPISSFNEAFEIEMFLETFEGFSGVDNDLVAGFGISLQDRAIFTVSKPRLKEVTGLTEAREGDLIWLPLSSTLLEIQFQENEEVFYTLGNVPYYKLHTEIFDYSGEDFDTGIPEIDDNIVPDLINTDNQTVNDLVDTLDDDIIDFTEKSPFGEFGS